MAYTYESGRGNPLANVSLYAIVKDLGRRELKGEGVKIKLKKDKYIIEIDKKEVDI